MTKRRADSEFVKKCLEHFLDYNPPPGAEKKVTTLGEFDEGCESLLELAKTLEQGLQKTAPAVRVVTKQWGHERRLKDD